MTMADMRGANMSGASFRLQDLRGANMSESNMSWANFTGANLRAVYGRKVNMTGACLARADMREANLRAATLAGADMRDANLTGADMRGATLAGANLRGAVLGEVSGAIGIVRSHERGGEYDDYAYAVIHHHADGTPYLMYQNDGFWGTWEDVMSVFLCRFDPRYRTGGAFYNFWVGLRDYATATLTPANPR